MTAILQWLSDGKEHRIVFFKSDDEGMAVLQTQVLAFNLP